MNRMCRYHLLQAACSAAEVNAGPLIEEATALLLSDADEAESPLNACLDNCSHSFLYLTSDCNVCNVCNAVAAYDFNAVADKEDGGAGNPCTVLVAAVVVVAGAL